jgi:hypothetical protein
MFACSSSSTCDLITEFSISPNNTLNCKEEYVIIDFTVLDANNVPTNVTGYLRPGIDNNIIAFFQKKIEVCKKFKW